MSKTGDEESQGISGPWGLWRWPLLNKIASRGRETAEDLVTPKLVVVRGLKASSAFLHQGTKWFIDVEFEVENKTNESKDIQLPMAIDSTVISPYALPPYPVHIEPKSKKLVKFSMQLPVKFMNTVPSGETEYALSVGDQEASFVIVKP